MQRFRQKTSSEEINQALSEKLGLSLDFLKILNFRGLNGEAEIQKFLSPSLSDMQNPAEIDGMTQAVKIIKKAVEDKKRILIFGDYDCDGVCATAILTDYFSSIGAQALFFIPDRNRDGYGISHKTLDKVLEREIPELVITVDCGISSADEIERLKSLGAQVIVTDHHEPQDKLPDCTLVDPKIAKRGFYEYCGAGVALKLVEALTDREFILRYLDIAAVATIADIVPLYGENRIIAYHGLKLMNKKMRKGVFMLLNQKTCDSYDVMFRLSPAINAAGRLDDASPAVRLFLSDDHFELTGLTQKLNAQNAVRQRLCDDAVFGAKQKLQSVDFSQCRLIALYDARWEPGILGVAASRLVEEFRRPTILFSDKDGVLKGSARSIREINIFETLSRYAELFETFGGHAQAAGLSIKKEKFAEFYDAANKYLKENFADEVFKKVINYDLDLDLAGDLLPFARELEKLEPTGYGNPKPVFRVKSDGAEFKAMGAAHIKHSRRNLSVVGFSKADFALSAKCASEWETLLVRNLYQNAESAQLILRDIYISDAQNITDSDLTLASVHCLSHWGETPQNVAVVSKDQAAKFLQKPFGTLFIAFSKGGLALAQSVSKDLPVSAGNLCAPNPENQIALVPCQNFDFRFYNDLVLCDLPPDGYISLLLKNGKGLHILENAKKTFVPPVSQETLREIYKRLKTLAQKPFVMPSLDELLKKINQGVDFTAFELSAALQIFNELRLISKDNKGIIEVLNRKVELSQSATYRNIARLSAAGG
jgi:single-stranded-DNA-specific exonuclease RecJ